MKRWKVLLNAFFALACLALITGCSSLGSKREQSTIRLYLEGHKADASTSGAVYVTRQKFLYTIEREPFLDESDLVKATVIEGADGTYSLDLTFNDHAALILDMTTASNKGKHIIVFSQFPVPGKHKPGKKKAATDADVVEQEDTTPKANSGPRQSAWLAAVLIRDRIGNGVLRFTPDATREETLRIARGLKNVISKNKQSNKF